MEALIKEKLKILRELGIRLTSEDKAKLNAAQSEFQLDSIAHHIIMR